MYPSHLTNHRSSPTCNNLPLVSRMKGHSSFLGLVPPSVFMSETLLNSSLLSPISSALPSYLLSSQAYSNISQLKFSLDSKSYFSFNSQTSKVVWIQCLDFFTSHWLPPMQIALCLHSSTKTALYEVTNDFHWPCLILLATPFLLPLCPLW